MIGETLEKFLVVLVIYKLAVQLMEGSIKNKIVRNSVKAYYIEALIWK